MNQRLDPNDTYTLLRAAELTPEKDRSPLLDALVKALREHFATLPERSVYYHG
jgi:hypothetical protein